MEKKKKDIIEYDGIIMDSFEELYIYWFFQELQKKGYVHSIERSASFTLSLPLVVEYDETVILKTKSKIVHKKQTLLKEKIYTPDFTVKWTEKGVNEFVHCLIRQDTLKLDLSRKVEKLFIGEFLEWQREGDKNIWVSYIEVKSDFFDPQNMERIFKNNQAVVWDRFKIFVNLVHPQELFFNSFFPAKYLITNKSGKKRKINGDLPILTLEQYLNKTK